MATMRVVQVSRAKGPLELVERKVPEPGPGTVRIRVEACGICHSDSMTKDGLWPGMQYPRVPGHEVAGVIDLLGANVTGWKVGDAVMAFCQNGYSQYVTARAAMLLPKPAEFTSHPASETKPAIARTAHCRMESELI